MKVKKSMIRTYLRFAHKLPKNGYSVKYIIYIKLKVSSILIDCLSTSNVELLSVAI